MLAAAADNHADPLIKVTCDRLATSIYGLEIPPPSCLRSIFVDIPLCGSITTTH